MCRKLSCGVLVLSANMRRDQLYEYYTQENNTANSTISHVSRVKLIEVIYLIKQ